MTTPIPNLAEETVAPDEAAVAAEFIDFLKATSAKHHPSGVMPRFNQGRPPAVWTRSSRCRTACLPSFGSASSPSPARIRRAFDSPTPPRSRTRSATFGACRSRSLA